MITCAGFSVAASCSRSLFLRIPIKANITALAIWPILTLVDFSVVLLKLLLPYFLTALAPSDNSKKVYETVTVCISSDIPGSITN